MKKVLSIKTEINDGSEDQKIEFVSEAEIEKKNEYIYILYNESEVSSMEGTKTIIKISKNRILILRKGRINSKLEFEVGRNYISKYRTEYGEFMLETISKKLEVNIDEKLNGKIFLNYLLSMNGNTSEHKMEIYIS